MPNSEYYVYLLVEVLADGEEVFYVGKGKNARAAAHLQEYVRSVAAGHSDDEQLALAGVVPLTSEASGALGMTPQASPDAEEHAKVRRIRAAHASGHGVRVDLLRTDLSEVLAYTIESAVIDALGLDKLANKVHGHGHGRIPALAALHVLDAAPVDIDVPAFQVVVTGVRGGGNSLSGLVGAEDEDIWENASQSWAIRSDVRREINAAGASTEPFVLIAVSKGPSSTYGGLILGVWEISRVVPGPERVDRNGKISAGWKYVAAPPTPRLHQLRERYLRRRSTVRGQPVPVRIG